MEVIDLENEQTVTLDKRQVTKKIILKCLTIIACALPAVFIEVLALITFKDVPFEENKSFILVVNSFLLQIIIAERFSICLIPHISRISKYSSHIGTGPFHDTRSI